MNKQELKRLCKGLKVKETGMYTKGYNIGINAVLSTLLSVGNPPLKFEELKAGDWVWDNLLGMYVKIASCDTDVIVVDQCYRYFKSAFDENRFYHHEVKENENAN